MAKITHCSLTSGTLRKRHITLTATCHQEDYFSKAITSLSQRDNCKTIDRGFYVLHYKVRTLHEAQQKQWSSNKHCYMTPIKDLL